MMPLVDSCRQTPLPPPLPLSCIRDTAGLFNAKVANHSILFSGPATPPLPPPLHTTALSLVGISWRFPGTWLGGPSDGAHASSGVLLMVHMPARGSF